MRKTEAYRCQYCGEAFSYPITRWHFGRCKCGGLKRERDDCPGVVSCTVCGQLFPILSAKVQEARAAHRQALEEHAAHEATAHPARACLQAITELRTELRRAPTEAAIREYYRLLAEWWALPPSADLTAALNSLNQSLPEDRQPPRWKPGGAAWRKAIERARAAGTQIRLYREDATTDRP